jgi:hypothetical protein
VVGVSELAIPLQKRIFPAAGIAVAGKTEDGCGGLDEWE